MSVVIVEGRRYHVPTSFTLGEARDMKQISGLDVLEVEPALRRGNPEATAAFIYICMRRVDPDVKLDDVWKFDLSRIEFREEAAEEDDPRPPAPSQEHPPERRPSASGSGDGSSGPDAGEQSSATIRDVSGVPV